MAYVYIRSEPQLWTAGYYDDGGKWQPESDHDSAEEAADRVATLNGGGPARPDYAPLRALAADWMRRYGELHARASQLGPCAAGEVKAAEAGTWRQAAEELLKATGS